jgi:hypothetical protein
VDAELIREGARSVLEANRREGTTPDGIPFRYHRPDARKYPAQFMWDSCFHAFALAHLDVAAAQDELRTLVAAQEPDGFIGHTIFWDAPIRMTRRPFYNVLAPDHRMTRTIQPPFVAMAWEAVASSSEDGGAFAAEGVAPLVRFHDWLAANRDPHGTGLLSIVQPDESGLDASPKFDELVGWKVAGFPGFIALVRENRRDDFRLDQIAARDGFVVEEVLVNVAYALSLEALARMSRDAEHAQRADAVRDALLERCLDPATGLFFDRTPHGPVRRVTWTSLAPLALPGLPRDVVERLAGHVLDPAEFWLPFPIPSTAASDPAFRPSTRLLRYWRGPTWMPCAWLVHRGLKTHGLTAEAAELAARVARLIERSGFREYYDPFDGRGMGAPRFGMSTLAVDIISGPSQ